MVYVFMLMLISKPVVILLLEVFVRAFTSLEKKSALIGHLHPSRSVVFSPAPSKQRVCSGCLYNDLCSGGLYFEICLGCD